MSLGPSAAEVARTLTAGFGTASLSTAFAADTAPALHAALDDGTIVLLADRRELCEIGLADLLSSAYTSTVTNRVVLVDVRSYAPLPDLTWVRAQLSAAGWARVATRDQLGPATAALVAVFGPEVAALIGPRSELMVLVVEVADCELRWTGGSTCVNADEYVLATVDPLAPDEGLALERITAGFTDRLLAMVRRLRPTETAGDDLSTTIAVRPVGLDRYGLTLHCALPDGNAGLGRMTFPVPTDTLDEAESRIRDLLHHHEHCQVRR